MNLPSILSLNKKVNTIEKMILKRNKRFDFIAISYLDQGPIIFRIRIRIQTRVCNPDFAAGLPGEARRRHSHISPGALYRPSQVHSHSSLRISGLWMRIRTCEFK